MVFKLIFFTVHFYVSEMNASNGQVFCLSVHKVHTLKHPNHHLTLSVTKAKFLILVP